MNAPIAREGRTRAGRLLVGMVVPLIATGCAETASSGDAAEAEGTPALATGALTEGERLFQGAWHLNAYGGDSRLGTLRIDDRNFHADGVHGEYVGYVSIRSDTSPPQIDFTIEECGCDFEGMTSTGIYYVEDDGAIVFAGPEPGDSRPTAFDEPNDMWRIRPLDPLTEGSDADGS